MIEQTVVGDLSARDLGHEVELTDGGATYRGLIRQTQHQQWPYEDEAKSTLFLARGSWSAHVKVPSETPCTIERDDPPAHAFADSAATVSACGRQGVTGLVVVDQRGWALITCADCLANKFDVPAGVECPECKAAIAAREAAGARISLTTYSPPIEQPCPECGVPTRGIAVTRDPVEAGESATYSTEIPGPKRAQRVPCGHSVRMPKDA